MYYLQLLQLLHNYNIVQIYVYDKHNVFQYRKTLLCTVYLNIYFSEDFNTFCQFQSFQNEIFGNYFVNKERIIKLSSTYGKM